MNIRATIALFAGLGIGCTSQIGHLSLVSTENISAAPPRLQRDVTGRDCINDWFGNQQPNLERAIDMAVAHSEEGNALTNVSITYRANWIFLFIRRCYTVNGDVVDVKSAGM